MVITSFAWFFSCPSYRNLPCSIYQRSLDLDVPICQRGSWEASLVDYVSVACLKPIKLNSIAKSSFFLPRSEGFLCHDSFQLLAILGLWFPPDLFGQQVTVLNVNSLCVFFSLNSRKVRIRHNACKTQKVTLARNVTACDAKCNVNLNCNNFENKIWQFLSANCNNFLTQNIAATSLPRNTTQM